MDLAKLKNLLFDLTCDRILVKTLAPNDNSKNQVYFGSGFEALHFFPNLQIVADTSGSHSTPILKARLQFSWLDEHGQVAPAPNAQLIFYPQYPEVRFSGFLKGCKNPPSALMKSREFGRVLFLGLNDGGRILAYVAGAGSPVAREFNQSIGLDADRLFTELVPDGLTPLQRKSILISELKRINEKGWIDSYRLASDGTILPCRASNCGGLTLEAELGVRPNAMSAPDFQGWEIKQHRVNKFERLDTGVITLMTPAPVEGYYKDKGIEDFIRKYGYSDLMARPDRINFGGIHRCGETHNRTNLKMDIIGVDPDSGEILDSRAGIALISREGETAAFWEIAALMEHWNRKHARAAYVPSRMRKEPLQQYQFGNIVRLCTDPDFHNLLKSFASGHVYYDPGLKLERASTSTPGIKARHQFRVRSKDIPDLYNSTEMINVKDYGGG